MQSWNTCGGDAWCLYRDVGIHPGYSASLRVQLSQSCLVPEYMHGSQGLNLSVVAASFLRACSRSLHSSRCSELVLVLQQSSRSRGSGPHGAGLGEGDSCAGHGSHPQRGRTDRPSLLQQEPRSVGHGELWRGRSLAQSCPLCPATAARLALPGTSPCPAGAAALPCAGRGWWCCRAGGRGGCQRRLASQSQTNRWRQRYPITQGLSGRG